MALKVNARIVGYGPDPSGTTALVAVIIEFDGPQETMEIKLLVQNENDKDAVHKQAMARAKDFARRFLDFPNAKIGWG
jgi:hypothetical protein